MSILPRNVLAGIPLEMPEELQETIAGSDFVRIERIVSRGQASPPDFWYDQAEHEFVFVLQGQARLAFRGQPDQVILRPGDYLDIPAHVPHRVTFTDPEQDTVWLAVHYR